MFIASLCSNTGMYLCLIIKIALTGSDLMIAIDNINTVCKIGIVIRLYNVFITLSSADYMYLYKPSLWPKGARIEKFRHIPKSRTNNFHYGSAKFRR